MAALLKTVLLYVTAGLGGFGGAICAQHPVWVHGEFVVVYLGLLWALPCPSCGVRERWQKVDPCISQILRISISISELCLLCCFCSRLDLGENIAKH